MVQRKGNFPVKDSRNSEERAQEDSDIMAAMNMVRFPILPWGAFLFYLAERTGKVNLNWSPHLKPVREPNSVQEKPRPGLGNILWENFQWE